MRCSAIVLGLLLLPLVARAQDTTRAIDRGVRVGITYTPGMRPSIMVLPAPALDSVRAIILRDLDYSDRFDVIGVPNTVASPARGGQQGATTALNYALYRTFGANYGVEIAPSGREIVVRLHDLNLGAMKQEAHAAIPDPGTPGFRMAVHQMSDQIVRWVTGTSGVAATQLLYISNKRVYRIDSDGENAVAITGETEEPLSPAWSPDGRRIAYTQFTAGKGPIVVLTLATGQRTIVPSTGKDLNITPVFAPDGRTLAFARVTEEGTDIYSADIADACCVQRLTVGRFADNLSPTYSPDGRQIAFVSTRAGLPQIYVMATDGTDQELFAPFDYGVTGSSNAPDWSPDGTSVVFHREVSRSPQLFVLDVASRRVRQLTSTGRNEDATWAPDGRHLAFVSDRSGRRLLWVIDVETGRIRQLTTSAAARLPAWSRGSPGSMPGPR